MTNLVILLDFITFLAGLALGIYIFAKNPRAKFNQAFAVTTLGVVGWNLTIFLLIARIGDALIPGRLAFSFLAVMVFGLVWFASIYPTRARFGKFFTWVFAILAVVFFAIPASPWFVNNIVIMDPGFITGDLHPVLFPLWSYYYYASLLFILIYLTARTIAAKGVHKLQLGQVLIGFALFLVPMVITQIILPMFFGDFRFNNLGPAFTIIMMGFLANAILRYRLMDIRWIVSKSLVFTILGLLIIWLLATTTFLISDLVASPVAIAIGAFIIVLIYSPMQRALDKLLDLFAHKGWYDPEKATSEVFEVVRNEGELGDLTKKISELFSHYFSTEQIGILVFSSTSSAVLNAELKGYNGKLTRRAKEVVAAAKAYGNQIVERGEMEWRLQYDNNKKVSRKDKKHQKTLSELEIETLIPFTVDGKLIGFMVFGERRYDRSLRARDIQFLNLIRSGISPALENAAKYAEIKKLYEQLSEADAVKSEFINVVSHRFRTPLSALRWNIETVLDSSARLNKDAKSMLVDSHDRTLFLVNTLDGLFDTLALESGKLKLKKSVFDFGEAAEPIIETYKRKAKEKGLEFTTELPKLTVFGDQNRIEYVLNVLLSNAVQYTQEGKISVSCAKKDGMAAVTVTDTGIGIPPKEKEKIFEKFYRAKNATSAYADGQGLGLYLVKQLVDMHKGDIEVVSTLAEGTSITVYLPQK